MPNFDTLVASYTLLFKIVRHFQKLFQEKIRLSTTFKQHSYGHQVVNFDTSVASLYHFSGHQRHFGSLLGIEKGGKCDILVAFTSQCHADVRHLGSILWKAFSLKYDTLVTFRQTAKTGSATLWQHWFTTVDKSDVRHLGSISILQYIYLHYRR